MTALAAMQRAHHEPAQMLRPLVKRRRREIERRRGLGFAIDLLLQLFRQAKREIPARCASCRALTSFQLPDSPASTRRCQRSGMNSLSRMSTQRRPNSGR